MFYNIYHNIYHNINAMLGVVFHTLKGVPGLSSLGSKIIDVAKVLDMSHRRRLFCIFDSEYPFTLKITYNEPKSTWHISPVVGRYTGAAFHPSVDLTQTLTKRYSSLDEVQKEIDEIKLKQLKLAEYAKKIEQDILNSDK